MSPCSPASPSPPRGKAYGLFPIKEARDGALRSTFEYNLQARQAMNAYFNGWLDHH